MTNPTKRPYPWLCAVFTLILMASPINGQTSTPPTTIPTMVKFSGTVQGTPSRIIGITFALYKVQQGGPALWLETQSVSLDATGHYTVQLGATLPNGLPKELFTSGEARWLGVQAEGQGEQPRVLLLSVPYALKAADAETIGGLPASAFVLAMPAASSIQSTTSAVQRMSASPQAPPPGTVSGTGTANFVPLWTDSADIANSVVFQSGTGATAKIGINTTTPAATLDVKGAATIRGLFTLPSTGVANATKGSNSQPIAMTASAFNSSTSSAANQNFRWQAEPAGNNTSSPSATLNLLFGAGSITPAETGLKISSAGLLTFASGQTFPGTGTISGITAGTGLSGGGTTGSVTLNLDTTKVPELNVANTFVGNQTVTGNVSATGVVTGSSFQIGSNLFAFGSFSLQNASLGFAGNAAATGSQNTASGFAALASDTTGFNNTATGFNALFANTSGGGNTAYGRNALSANTAGFVNTASGDSALGANTTGQGNTATGQAALANNTTGNYNTVIGYLAGPDTSTPNLTNSTAIGAFADVTASNALVLGSINGVNGATASTNVGIGTTAPAAKLDVHGNANFTGLITFAAGQTFPGAGTITGVTAGTGLTGGGSTGSITLNLDTTKVPQLSTANSFVGDQGVTGNLTASGTVTGGVVSASTGFNLGGSLFAFGSPSSLNVFLGYSGNTTATGQENTATGNLALHSNTTGGGNTASGYQALVGNSTGGGNTASGIFALEGNTTGSNNTASGIQALQSNNIGIGNTADGAVALSNSTNGNFNTASGNGALSANTSGSNNTASGTTALANNTTGSNNTALGSNAGPDSSHPSLTNATAIGANAVVSASNAMVLGAPGVSVGIGTATPAATLDVHGTGNFTSPITFAAGQTFPGAGTITGVTPGTALTGGGSSGSVTLNVDMTKVVTGISAGTGLTGGGTGGVQTLSVDTTKTPQLSTANTFTGNQTVNGNLTATGVITGSGFQIGGALFVSAAGYKNTFLGFAGNTTLAGGQNTATGYQALLNDTSGGGNTAVGNITLQNITTGGGNTAVGDAALKNITTGSLNVAMGEQALFTMWDSSGSSNTAIGAYALWAFTGGAANTALGANTTSNGNTNTTAIGANAEVDEDNALVLGSINGVNGATASTNVGIGTTAPTVQLQVQGNDNTGTGVQSLTNNTSTSGNSFAVVATTSSAGVTNEMVVDGLGTGPLATPSGYFGTYTNQPVGVITSNVLRMFVDTTGKVGINTKTPDNTLSVNGNADKVGGGSWGTFSDGRLKNLNGSFNSGLSEILKLHPIRYHYKEENAMGIRDHDEHVGFVAQDVQKVIPEAVTENDRGYLLVNNDPILWTMLNAIKEQQKEIRDLRSELRATRRSLRKVKAQVAATQPALVAKKQSR